LRKKVVALVILAMVLISLAPLAVMYVLSRYRYQPEPDPLLERIRESARSKIAVLSPREFEVVRPLTWAESTLSLGEEALYSIAPELEGHVNNYRYFVNHMYYFVNVYNIRNCTLLEYYIKTLLTPVALQPLDPNDLFDRRTREFLLGDDCQRLYRLFSHEESWYASMGALGYASEKYLELNNVTHWKQVDERVFMLAHVEVGDEGVRRIRIKFYNVSNDYEAEEMERDVRSLLLGYPKVLFIHIKFSHFWHDIFTEMVSEGAQIVVFNGVLPYDVSYWDAVEDYSVRFMSWVVEGDQLAEIEKFIRKSWGGLYIVNGKVVRKVY